MAFFHGKAAKVNFAATIESTISWSLDITVDTSDTTAMGNTWKTSLPGFYDFTATVEGYARTTRGTVAQCGAVAHALVLYIAADHYFTASTVICTSITESVSKDDVGKLSYTLAGNDADGLVYT